MRDERYGNEIGAVGYSSSRFVDPAPYDVQHRLYNDYRQEPDIIDAGLVDIEYQRRINDYHTLDTYNPEVPLDLSLPSSRKRRR